MITKSAITHRAILLNAIVFADDDVDVAALDRPDRRQDTCDRHLFRDERDDRFVWTGDRRLRRAELLRVSGLDDGETLLAQIVRHCRCRAGLAGAVLHFETNGRRVERTSETDDEVLVDDLGAGLWLEVEHRLTVG